MQHLKSVQIRPRKLALSASCCAFTSSDVPPPQACALGPDFALQARAELVSPACAGGRLCALRAPPFRTVGALSRRIMRRAVDFYACVVLFSRMQSRKRLFHVSHLHHSATAHVDGPHSVTVYLATAQPQGTRLFMNRMNRVE